MDPPYNVHLTQNSVQCKPNAKIVHHSANRALVCFPYSLRLCSNDEGGCCQFFLDVLYILWCTPCAIGQYALCSLCCTFHV